MAFPRFSARAVMSRRSRTLRAFTLVELLVVIAIIAILAAILVPVLGGMQRKGQQTASASNLRQWFTGFTAAVGENDGTMPHSGNLNGQFRRDDEQAWFNRLPQGMRERPLGSMTPDLLPQLGQKSVWINPAATVPGGAQAGGFIFCYGFNERLKGTDAEGNDVPLKIANLQFPVITVLMAEKADSTPQLNELNAADSIRAFFGGGDPRLDPDNQANFLFCDGHVEPVKRKVFSDGSMVAQPEAIEQKLTNLTFLYRLPE